MACVGKKAKEGSAPPGRPLRPGGNTARRRVRASNPCPPDRRRVADHRRSGALPAELTRPGGGSPAPCGSVSPREGDTEMAGGQPVGADRLRGGGGTCTTIHRAPATVRAERVELSWTVSPPASEAGASSCSATPALRSVGSASLAAPSDLFDGDFFSFQGSIWTRTTKPIEAIGQPTSAGARGIGPRRQRFWRPPGNQRLTPLVHFRLSARPGNRRSRLLSEAAPDGVPDFNVLVSPSRAPPWRDSPKRRSAWRTRASTGCSSRAKPTGLLPRRDAGSPGSWSRHGTAWSIPYTYLQRHGKRQSRRYCKWNGDAMARSIGSAP